MYMAYLEAKILINPIYKAQIALLIMKKVIFSQILKFYKRFFQKS